MKKIAAVLLCLFLFMPMPLCRAIYNITAETDKKIFLTFDDGPTDSVTPKVLDILAQEKVKATFFVTGRQIKNREKIIERIAKEGHALGVHTYSHEYARIYANKDALLLDIEKCKKEICRVLPDYNSDLYRFPGGSFMHPEYREAVQKAGFRYYDWNAMTADAEKAHSAKELFENAVKTSKDKKQVIMLMHDGITKSKTAEALTPIIKYFKKEGFSFMTL